MTKPMSYSVFGSVIQMCERCNSSKRGTYPTISNLHITASKSYVKQCGALKG